MQTGPTATVYQRPETLRAAEVFSDPPINALDSAVADGRAVMGDNIPVPLTGHMANLADGSYRFAFRSNHLWLSSQTDGDLAITGTVELAEINGSETFIYIHHGKSAFVVQQEGVHPFAMGNEITVFINPKHLFVYGTAGQLVAAPPAAEPYNQP
jgi:glycerol transport system ATP-binding protein